MKWLVEYTTDNKMVKEMELVGTLEQALKHIRETLPLGSMQQVILTRLE